MYRNKDKLQPGIKISPSLTTRRKKILTEAHDLVSSVSSVHFVYADIHGDLKVRFNEADKDGRYVVKFNTTDDLAEIIRGLDFSEMDVGSVFSDVESDSEI